MAGAAVVLPDPAIAVASRARGGTTSDVVEPRILDSLREEVRRRAVREGHLASSYPGLWYYRADAPAGPKRVGVPGVVVAVIVDREKVVELADGRRLAYTPGSYLFMTRETRYVSRIVEASARRPYMSFGLTLEPEIVAETLLEIDDTGVELDGEDGDAWVEPYDDDLGEAFLRLLRSIDDPTERRVLSPLIVREIVFRLLRSEHAGPLRRAARADDARIREAMRVVRSDPGGRVTVEGLAKRVAMSPSHFAHRFREVARMTPMRFVKNVRLDEARLRMVRDGLRASEVAEQVGYASASHFTRDFKSHYGATPAAYVRELRARLDA